jgi:hypothetical protein
MLLLAMNYVRVEHASNLLVVSVSIGISISRIYEKTGATLDFQTEFRRFLLTVPRGAREELELGQGLALAILYSLFIFLCTQPLLSCFSRDRALISVSRNIFQLPITQTSHLADACEEKEI